MYSTRTRASTAPASRDTEDSLRRENIVLNMMNKALMSMWESALKSFRKGYMTWEKRWRHSGETYNVLLISKVGK